MEKWRRQFIDKHEQELADKKRRAGHKAATVGEYVSSYIDTLRTLGKEESTITGYQRMLDYINKGAPVKDGTDAQAVAIGHLELERLDREAVQTWVNDMAKRLAPVTVKKALTVLRAALKNACKDGRLNVNPAEFVDPPMAKAAPQNPLNDRQQQTLLADLDAYTQAHPKDPSRLAIKTALLTGMRQGELCALRWADVDTEARTIDVKQSVGRRGDAFKSGNKSHYIKEPKNGGSRRTIPIPAPLLHDLKRRKAQMIEECLAAGIPFTPDLYVFGSIDGAFMNPHGLWMKWKRIAKRLKLTGLDGDVPKFHDLRHTFATTAIKNGMDVKTLSSILGHANAAMTLNIYASADPDAKRAAMDKMGDFYAGLSSKLNPGPEVIEFKPTGTEDN